MSFPEVMIYLIPGDIFYELMQLSALLYWGKKNWSAVQMCFILDLLLSFNMSLVWFMLAVKKEIKKREITIVLIMHKCCLNAGRKVSRLKFLLLLTLPLTS